MALARQIKTSRAGNVDLFYCLDCESFCSPFAPDNLNGPTLNHHLRVLDRNIEFSRIFIPRLFEHIKPKRIIDVGCGIGTLLHSARIMFNIEGVGFDLDAEACSHGKERFALDLRAEPWSTSAHVVDVDLILCVMVLEHLKWPRPLLFELISGAKKNSCPLFVAVPWFNRAMWKDLLDPTAQSSMLAQPWVHVTHFSESGFMNTCREMGAKKMIRISGHPWPGYLIWAD